MPDGTRVRQNFADRLDAVRKCNELNEAAAGMPERSQLRRTRLTPAQLADAEAAVQHAGPQKLSRIVSHYLALQDRAQAKGTSLDQAMTFVEARYRPETEEITIYNAIQEFIQSRVGLSPKTVSNYDHNLNLLLKSDPNKPVHAFSVSDVEQAVGKTTNLNTRRTRRRVFSIFFNWAERHHYCLENPCARLDKLPKNTSAIAILSLEEVKRLLRAAIEYHEGVAASSIAIALFAGLRPSELQDLKRADIRASTIIVRGGKLRRSGNRRVPIPENLRAWLEEFPFDGLSKGWSYKLKKLKDATKAEHWVQDILRHTSISHQAERDKNEGETAYNNGTSKEMMDRHYRDLVDKEEDIQAYWALTPEVVRKEEIKVSLPSRQKVSWPPKAKLKKLVWSKPLVHAAVGLGVTDVALRKHCLKTGIDLPKRGHWLRT